jgi:hypothetical protein
MNKSQSHKNFTKNKVSELPSKETPDFRLRIKEITD